MAENGSVWHTAENRKKEIEVPVQEGQVKGSQPEGVSLSEGEGHKETEGFLPGVHSTAWDKTRTQP